jgi:hypothetical protein
MTISPREVAGWKYELLSELSRRERISERNEDRGNEYIAVMVSDQKDQVLSKRKSEKECRIKTEGQIYQVVSK